MIVQSNEIREDKKTEIGDKKFQLLCERIEEAASIYAQMQNGYFPADEEAKNSMRRVLKSLCMELDAIVDGGINQ